MFSPTTVIDPVFALLVPTLIEPLSKPDGLALERAWGIEAVRADSSPQDGKGVTVAVLDTGIDKLHPAFFGIQLERDDIMDFSTMASLSRRMIHPENQVHFSGSCGLPSRDFSRALACC